MMRQRNCVLWWEADYEFLLLDGTDVPQKEASVLQEFCQQKTEF